MEEKYYFIVDKRSRITDWGEKIGRITGIKADDALGKKYSETFPEILSSNKDAVTLALSSNRKVTLNGYSIRCPFKLYSADIRIDPIVTENGVAGARITIFHLNCPMLKSQHEGAGIADKNKTASMIAHGIRNPLNAVKGVVEYLSGKYTQDAALNEFSNIMHDEITRFDEFISKFLRASSAEKEVESLINVNSLLKKIEVLTSFQTRVHNIKADYIYGNIPDLKTNSFQLGHAVLNIINNSIEAMPSGGEIRVKSMAASSKSGDDCVVIEISDTGPGMTDDNMGHGMPSEEKDKGFGLFITREILRTCGGHLEIKGHKNKGTVVSMYLPVQGEGE